MAGRTRCTRKLRSWMVEQVNSEKYPGLVWDDEAKTMFRIPWKHAGKQDFRKDDDAAIFKAWAEFKGKLTGGGQDSPAAWKTRLRCALNKSPEFREVDRAQLDISEPYKVYRLVPLSEQGVSVPERKSREKPTRKSKRRRSGVVEQDEEDTASDAVVRDKRIKTEDFVSQLCVDDALLQSDINGVQKEEPVQHRDASISSSSSNFLQSDGVDEIRLDLRIEESAPAPGEVHDSFNVAVHYLGREVLKRHVPGSDVRIAYLPSSIVAPTPSTALRGRFPCVPLPEPPSAVPELLPPLLALLPFMERGVVLTSGLQGLYGRRYCQGRVFWTGPQTTTVAPHKMERDTEPVLLFSRDAFKQQMDHFCSHGGNPPQCGVTLCFGEELSDSEDLNRKLIIVQITLPWAEQQVQNAQSLFGLFQSLSPLGEITLNLVAVPTSTSDPTGVTCGSL